MSWALGYRGTGDLTLGSLSLSLFFLQNTVHVGYKNTIWRPNYTDIVITCITIARHK